MEIIYKTLISESYMTIEKDRRLLASKAKAELFAM